MNDNKKNKNNYIRNYNISNNNKIFIKLNVCLPETSMINISISLLIVGKMMFGLPLLLTLVPPHLSLLPPLLSLVPPLLSVVSPLLTLLPPLLSLFPPLLSLVPPLLSQVPPLLSLVPPLLTLLPSHPLLQLF